MARNNFRNMQHAVAGKMGIAEPNRQRMGLDGGFTDFKTVKVRLRRKDKWG